MEKIDILDSVCVRLEDKVQDAISCIEKNVKKVAVVVGEDYHLEGIITDGDIRRFFLEKKDFSLPIKELLEQKKKGPYPSPLRASSQASKEELRKIMEENMIRHIPLVDEKNRICQLITLREVSQSSSPRAIIMAGGYGKRLHPLTQNLPKPMLPVGDRPLIEHTIENLKLAGIHHVYISTHYMPEKIKEHFGNGEEHDINLRYITEESPLGTAGAIRLLEESEEPLLVINGDILTKLDYDTMLRHHQENKAALTVAVKKYDFKVPYGVVESEGFLVKGLVEKPSLSFFVNAGIYLLSPKSLQYIPKEKRFDMTELIEKLLEEKCSVHSFPIVEYWLDIGKHSDYEQAQNDARDGKLERKQVSKKDDHKNT